MGLGHHWPKESCEGSSGGSRSLRELPLLPVAGGGQARVGTCPESLGGEGKPLTMLLGPQVPPSSERCRKRSLRPGQPGHPRHLPRVLESLFSWLRWDSGACFLGSGGTQEALRSKDRKVCASSGCHPYHRVPGDLGSRPVASCCGARGQPPRPSLTPTSGSRTDHLGGLSLLRPSKPSGVARHSDACNLAAETGAKK